MIVKYAELAVFLKENQHNSEGCLNYIEKKSGNIYTEKEREIASKKVHEIQKAFKRRWNDSRVARNWRSFERKHSAWLKLEVDISVTRTLHYFASSSKGRPTVNFKDACDRVKAQRTSNAIAASGTDPLLHLSAAKKSADMSKQRDLVKVIDHVMSDVVANKSSSTLDRLQINNDPLPMENALSIYMDSGVSKRKFNILRKPLAENGVKILPSYYKIGQQKMSCYPEGMILNFLKMKRYFKIIFRNHRY
jgi:hypothetical protein